MDKGHFYFIDDTFYAKYDQAHKLMQNKERDNGIPKSRPCFFAFEDKKNSEIFWCVPISSKVEKYEAIYNQKIQRQIERNVKNPKCNTIRFGEVMGQKRAFLIQNMFPVTRKYVSAPYIDKNTHNEVTISPQIENDIIVNARDVLKLSQRNIPVLFADVKAIYNSLEVELKESALENESEHGAVDGTSSVLGKLKANINTIEDNKKASTNDTLSVPKKDKITL